MEQPHNWASAGSGEIPGEEAPAQCSCRQFVPLAAGAAGNRCYTACSDLTVWAPGSEAGCSALLLALLPRLKPEQSGLTGLRQPPC